MYQFPKDLYADVRIEEMYGIWLEMRNGETEYDSARKVTGAMIRVFDGTMWYTGTTNKLDEIQKELDNLAALATPNPDILNHPMVKKLEVHKVNIEKFTGEQDIRNIGRSRWKELSDHYIETCVDESIPEINDWKVEVSGRHIKKSFYSSKGAEILQDFQECWLTCSYGFTVDGVTTYGVKYYSKFFMEDLLGKEEEIIKERDRYLDFVRNAVPVEPGEYTCVLSPAVTALFTHESFGHKSEADYMLNDKTLQDEWVIGKKVGSPLVSICDRGDMLNHGYTPYDDEGTKAKGVWLMKDGVLTGRLHDAKSAAVLKEELTGNCRAESYESFPIVRMTNTYMAAGKDDPEQMIKDVKDGIYIYTENGGTGGAIFTMQPAISYRIRDGKLCEPLKINVITGNVFETLFNVDAVGTDFELFDTSFCGKDGQWIEVSDGGPSIRVKKLTVN